MPLPSALPQVYSFRLTDRTRSALSVILSFDFCLLYLPLYPPPKESRRAKSSALPPRHTHATPSSRPVVGRDTPPPGGIAKTLQNTICLQFSAVLGFSGRLGRGGGAAKRPQQATRGIKRLQKRAKGPPMDPKRSQKNPKRLQKDSKKASETPKRPQGGPKRPQKGPPPRRTRKGVKKS